MIFRPPVVSRELTLLAEHLALAAGLPARAARAGAIDAQLFRALIEEHQLGPFLVARSPKGFYPRALEVELEGARLRAGYEAFFRHFAIRRVLDVLDAVGVRAVLLKGSALVDTLYAQDAEREMSDVDLLLESDEAIARARACLEREGYRAAREDAKDHHHAPPLESAIAELVFELHTNLATPQLPGELMRMMLERAVVIGASKRRVLDPVFRLLHHALHALSDPLDSPLLRNLFEVGWMAHRLDERERTDFSRIVDRFRLARRVAPALHMAAQLFSTPQLLPGSAINARALWGWRRLGWVRSFEDAGQATRARRIERSIAAEHFRALKRGGTVVGAIAKIGREKLRGVFDGFGRATDARSLLFPARVSSRAIGDRLLVHDLQTKRVHLLDHLSRAVFEAVEQASADRSPQAVARRLEAEGADPVAVRAVLADLITLELVTQSRSG